MLWLKYLLAWIKFYKLTAILANFAYREEIITILGTVRPNPEKLKKILKTICSNLYIYIENCSAI